MAFEVLIFSEYARDVCLRGFYSLKWSVTSEPLSMLICLSKAKCEELAQQLPANLDEPMTHAAQLLFLLSAGQTWAVIHDKLDCTDNFNDHWGQRFMRGAINTSKFALIRDDLSAAADHILDWASFRPSTSRKPGGSRQQP